MPFTIPNTADAFSANQAQPDSVDFAILSQGDQGQGVLYGLAVAQRGAGANMSVDVAGGVMVWNGLAVVVATTTTNKAVTAAHATNPRYDLVSAKNDGTLAVTAGTPSTNPVFPAVPVGSVALAAVYVPAAETTIVTSRITDKRTLIPSASSILSPGPAAANAMDDEFDDASGMSGAINGLNARWTWDNQDTSTATFPRAGYVKLVGGGAGTHQIDQAVPSGDWTFETCMSQDSPGVENIGFVLRDPTTGRDHVMWLLMDSGSGRSPRLLGMLLNSATYAWISTFFPTSGICYVGSTRLYLRVAYVSATKVLTFYWSHDGIGWVTGLTSTAASAITRIGLCVSETARGYYDYFRRIA